jgi:hypothetical protein
MVIDLFLLYQFIKRLATPFNEWEAYKLGIIDEKGNQLVKRRKFTKQKEHDAFGLFDILVMKLKRLLEKIPGGKTRLGSYAAALWLIKESKNYEDVENLNEEDLLETFSQYMILAESVVDEDMETLFEKSSEVEENIANTAANIPQGEPGMTSSKMKKYKNKNQKSPVMSFRRHVQAN